MEGERLSLPYSSSEDSLLGAMQALPSNDVPVDYEPDMSKVMTSVDEYMRFVKYESSKLPDVLCDKKRFTKSNDESVRVPTPDLASAEVVTVFEEFKSTRRVCQCTLNLSNLQIVDQLRKLFASAKKPDLEAGETQFMINSVPKVSVIGSLSYCERHNLICHVAASIKASNDSLEQMLRWAFSLLVFVDEPVHPDLLNELRTLAKVCKHKRSKLIDDAKEPILASQLDCIITIVRVFFKQFDL